MKSRWINRIVAAAALLCALAYQIAPLASVSDSAFDVASFGKLPSATGGRVQPLDSIARNTLLMLNNRQTVRDGEVRMDAITWLLEMIAKPEEAAERRIFRIDHPGVLATLGLAQSSEHRFTFREIAAGRDELQRQVDAAMQTLPDNRNLFQRKILQLDEQFSLYRTLGSMFNLNLIPPAKSGGEWLAMHTARNAALTVAQRDIAEGYAVAFQAFANGDATQFNRSVARLQGLVDAAAPDAMRKASHEATFNHMEVFSRALVLYVAVVLLVFASWLAWRAPVSRAAMVVFVFVFLVHTVGIGARIYISGRPPVTNLYSSALFVGWGAILLCIALERIFKNGMGVMTGAIAGFLTLMIAQGLSNDGDTMAVLQAVLDTNFWLATHVVVITLGYASTYLAAFLGIGYVLRGVLTTSFGKDESKRVSQMIYGILCFATLFSFVGTILGGIWADQSWGRFWGWDPKENGAMIIVLWNALVLHARWGGIVKQRGVAVLAIFGSIVTSWSWFGVNMLGRGLHSYGFMESAAFWLVVFVASQLAFIALGMLPQSMWRSSRQSDRSPVAS